MKEDTLDIKDVHQAFDTVMKRILDLGQSSLSEAQFQAFRKMTMDFFADGKRNLKRGQNQGRYGSGKIMTKGVVTMSE